MSILLEALRKSEKNQQAHEVPTIHSDDPSGQDSETLKFLPMATMLIVALVVSGWFIWRQYEAPEGSYQPPVSLPSYNVPGLAKPGKQASEQASEQGGNQGNAQTGGAAEETVKKPADKPAGGADKAVPNARTPVESFKKPQTETAQPPAPKSDATAKRSPASKTAANQKAAPKPKPKASTPPETVTPPPQKSQPSEPKPISYWELPDAVRASVPEIKFSVLVYASKPSDRFVLINGQRLREGDSLPSGPVVAEIRRDGVVFTHRLYRFLVER